MLALALAACSGDANEPAGSGGSGGSGATASGGSGGAAAGGAGNGGSSGVGASSGGAGGASGGSGGDGGTSTTTASIYGQIGRTARIPAGLDGIGDVYIAVFADNPVTNMNAEALANTLIEDADLSQDGTGINYRVDNIEPSSSPRYIVAFMDDDDNVTLEDPAPAKPDLIAFDGLSPITVTLATPGEHELNLILNAEIPF